MSELEVEMTALRRLVGEWSGGGRGDFPTIDAFRYTETMRFYWNGIEPMLQFEQRTWVANDTEPRKDPLHWETGFIRALPQRADYYEHLCVADESGSRVLPAAPCDGRFHLTCAPNATDRNFFVRRCASA